MSYDEISRILSIDADRVKEIEQVALRKLRRFENRHVWWDIRDSLNAIKIDMAVFDSLEGEAKDDAS